MTLQNTHYWVGLFQPITEATRSLESVPLVCSVANLYPRPHSRPVVASRGIPSSLLIASSTSYSVANLFFFPSKYKPSYSHHLQDTLVPGLQADRSQRSRIGRIAIYCAAVFRLLWVYVLIPSKPASTITSSNEGYSKIPSPCLLDCLPVSRRATVC